MLNAVHGYLPAVVEVPVGVHLQLLHLLHLIQHLMHIELRHEELQTTVTVSLTAKQEFHCEVIELMIDFLKYKYIHKTCNCSIKTKQKTEKC